MAPKKHGPWNSQAVQQLPSQCLNQCTEWSIIHLLLCDVHSISVYKPNRSCEASLQYKCSHNKVCHKVLLPLLTSFNPSYSYPAALTPTVASLYTRVANIMKVFSSPAATKSLITACWYKCMSVSAILESTLLLPSVKQQRCIQ